MGKIIILVLIVAACLTSCSKTKVTEEVIDKTKQPIGVSVTVEDNTSYVVRVY